MSTNKRFLALIALVAMTACGGGTPLPNSMTVGNALHRGRVAPQSSILSSIVGVGDSLTAGYQSNGFLGETGITTKFDYNKFAVPQGQENGFWADLWEEASGLSLDDAIAKVYDPSTSPLPLINGPGLNNQIISVHPLLQVIAEQKSGNICTDNNGFNNAAYHLKGITRVRMDPTSINIRDLGVPGLTLHEANVLHQPQSNTCRQLPGIEGLLNLVVADESESFWPVLGNFTKLGGNLSDVNAAASQHPTLATVWLGANDVLKYMGSGGRFHGGDDSAGQAESDVRAAVSTLQHAGAKVVVANLPNILRVAYFQRVTNPAHYKDCAIQTYAFCALNLLVSATRQEVTQIANRYHLSTPQGCEPASTAKPCGYLTLQGVIELVQYKFAYNNFPDLDCANPAPHCKDVPGSGLGNYYITPEFAGKIQQLNQVINQGINDAASASHVPLVDVTSVFDGIASGNPSNPYFRLASSISPKNNCCELGYLYGLLSFDGLHPSNTGYALIANVFIDVINKGYGTKIPQVDVVKVYNGTRCSTPVYCYPDPYAPPNDISG